MRILIVYKGVSNGRVTKASKRRVMKSKTLVDTFSTIGVEEVSNRVVESVVIPVETPADTFIIIPWELPERVSESLAMQQLGKIIAHLENENMNL